MSLPGEKRKLEDLLVLRGRGEAEERKQSSDANDLPFLSLGTNIEDGHGPVNRMIEPYGQKTCDLVCPAFLTRSPKAF